MEETKDTGDTVFAVRDEFAPIALATVIINAMAAVAAEGWVPVAVDGQPGTTFTWALCQAAGCDTYQPGYPITHTDACRMAHARVVGWLYLEGLAGIAEVRVPEALGEWERWSRPGGALVAFVGASTVSHLMLQTITV